MTAPPRLDEQDLYRVDEVQGTTLQIVRLLLPSPENPTSFELSA